METSNADLSVFLSRMLSSVSVSALNVDWKNIHLFYFNKFAAISGPMSPDGPQYIPNTHSDLGKLTAVLQSITQKYHLNSANSEMSPVCPVTMVSGTSPFRSYILWAVLDCIIALSSEQLSYSTFKLFSLSFSNIHPSSPLLILVFIGSSIGERFSSADM